MTDSHNFICIFDPRAIQIVNGIEGLFLAADTVRARGVEIDKAACSGISAAEAMLDRRLGHFASAVRY